MYVYLITNLVNGKKYVGQTIQNPHDRWLRHKSTNTFGTVIGKAIHKYGKDNFSFEVIDEANSIEELNKKEIDWISQLNTVSTGYNLRSGGENGMHSESTKEKISQSLQGITRPYFHKKVICVNTGEEFNSQTEACNQLGLRIGSIAESIRKNYKVNGTLIFKYKEI